MIEAKLMLYLSLKTRCLEALGLEEPLSRKFVFISPDEGHGGNPSSEKQCR